ncbi:MAG: hypothetical protein ABXS92_06100 [Sulfurimonas sp.]
MKKHYFWTIAFFYAVAVFCLASTTPISPHEAKIFYTSSDIVSLLMKWGTHSTDILGIDTFLGLRLFFIFFALMSIWLFYRLTFYQFSKAEDRYLATLIFMLLPGIVTGASLANIAIIVLPVILLFVLLYEKGYFWILPFLMLILFFIHEASVIFFIAILIYAMIYKEKKLMISSLVFLIAFGLLAKGIAIRGRPSGHFAEIFGLYATVFSPFVFIYFFYTMYRTLLKGEKPLIWFISFTALAISLLLSLRQQIHITDFAPYVMIAVGFMLQGYYQSIRVRLPRFQKPYRIGFRFVIAVLVFNMLLVVFHQVTYYMSGKYENHFAKRIYQPYDLAQRLKEKGNSCYDTSNMRIRLQLKYYTIPSCNN